MKKVSSLLIFFDIWCLLALIQLPFIYQMPNLWAQLLNYALNAAITFFWLHMFITNTKSQGWSIRLSWYLRSLTLGLTGILSIVAIVTH